MYFKSNLNFVLRATKLALQHCEVIDNTIENNLQKGFHALDLDDDKLQEVERLSLQSTIDRNGKWSSLFNKSYADTFKNIEQIPGDNFFNNIG